MLNWMSFMHDPLKPPSDLRARSFSLHVVSSSPQDVLESPFVMRNRGATQQR
jgi:hypothetical protein